MKPNLFLYYNFNKNTSNDFKKEMYYNIIKWNIFNKDNFNIKFYDNNTATKLLSDNNNLRVLKAFNKCKVNTMKADILKYYLLSKYKNSIYIDSNFIPNSKITLDNPLLLNNKNKLNTVSPCFKKKNYRINNAILSNFNNKMYIFSNLLHTGVYNILNNKYMNTQYGAISKIIGPMLYQKILEKEHYNIIDFNDLVNKYKIIKTNKLRDPNYLHWSNINIKDYY